jgi:hypothetical protein
MEIDMNRFFLFAGCDFYPQGGMHDFIGSFTTFGDAYAAAKACLAPGDDQCEWWHILDTETHMITHHND